MYIEWYVFVLFFYVPKVILDDGDQNKNVEKLIPTTVIRKIENSVCH